MHLLARIFDRILGKYEGALLYAVSCDVSSRVTFGTSFDKSDTRKVFLDYVLEDDFSNCGVE